MEKTPPYETQMTNNTPTPENGVQTPSKPLSPSDILNQFNALLDLPDQQSIDSFLKNVQMQLSHRLSHIDSPNYMRLYGEFAEVFYCMFNFLKGLQNNNLNDHLFTSISGLMDLYFNFIAIYREDFSLCFIKENPECLELYKKVHKVSDQELEELNLRQEENKEADIVHEENIKEENKQESSDNVQDSEGKEFEGINEKTQIKLEIQSGHTKKKQENKLVYFLSVDLMLVEVLDGLLDMEETKNRKEVIESLLCFYDTMSLSLFHYISKTEPVDMAIINKIAMFSVRSVKWISQERETQENFLPILANKKTFHIEFFLSLLSLNLSCVEGKRAHMQLNLTQNIIQALNQTEKNDRLRGSVDDIATRQLEYDLEAISDKALNNKDSLVDMFKELILVKDFIIYFY